MKIRPMPRVAVIIPAFNRAAVLPRAVASVLNQDYRDYELIVVDDASTDDTAERMRRLSGGHRLAYHRLPLHRGVSAARNIGVSRTRAPLVAFLDSDDCWDLDKLSRHLEWIDRHPAFRLSQTRERWVRAGRRVNPPKTHEKRHGWIFEESLRRCMITPSSVIIQRSLFEEVGGFNESLPVCEDYELWLRITCRYPVGLLDRYLLTRYGGRDDQLSNSFMGLDRFRIRGIMDLLGSGVLDERRAESARRSLREKARIVGNGYRKRGNDEFWKHYRRIGERYAAART